MENFSENVRFSVIVIGYNIEDYIERAIRSVENQSFKNFELIVVNDNSSDNTKFVVENLKNEFDNIFYIEHEVNKRPGGARNSGLDIAKGQYIIFLDGDDYLADDFVLEKLDKVIGNDDVDVIHLGFKMVGIVEKTVIPTVETCSKTYKAAKDKYPNPWSKCWKRTFLEENNIRFKENRLYEDVLFVYNGIMKSNSMKIADFVVHNYVTGRAGSVTTKVGIKNIKDTVQNIEDFLSIREKEPVEEIDIIIKKEIDFCINRLNILKESLYGENK